MLRNFALAQASLLGGEDHQLGLLLAPPGLLLASPGSSWLPLAPPSLSWLLVLPFLLAEVGRYLRGPHLRPGVKVV